MKNKQTLPADLSQEEYKNYKFTWWEDNALYIIGSSIFIAFSLLIYSIV